VARLGTAVAGGAGDFAAAPGACSTFERVRVDRSPSRSAAAPARESLAWILALGQLTFPVASHLLAMIALLGQLILDLGYLCVHPRDIPWREFSANLYKSGAQALPVTALIGFLIGIVLSYLSALQLKTFGADVFIVNLLGISIVRELGPVLVAVLVAGRSGSAMTAQIGVMRVTEEIDALATMGVSRSQRLILPKVLALAVAMPLLVIWCSAAGIIGGMVSAKLQMDLVLRLLHRYPAEGGAGCQRLDRRRQGFGFRCADCAHRLPLRAAGQAEYRKPVVADDHFGGDLDHRGDHRRCRLCGTDAQPRDSLVSAQPKTPSRRPARLPAIEIRGLCTQFGEVVIHRDIDLDIEAGQMLGLVGGSGSGKTTLLREIVGLLAPSQGKRQALRPAGTRSRSAASARAAPPLRHAFSAGGALFGTLRA
jgi:ABC transport permease subunit